MSEATWHRRALCLQCGWHAAAWQGKKFFVTQDVCPYCGSLKVDWRIRTMRCVTDSSNYAWWRPSTWLCPTCWEVRVRRSVFGPHGGLGYVTGIMPLIEALEIYRAEADNNEPEVIRLWALYAESLPSVTRRPRAKPAKIADLARPGRDTLRKPNSVPRKEPHDQDPV